MRKRLTFAWVIAALVAVGAAHAAERTSPLGEELDTLRAAPAAAAALSTRSLRHVATDVTFGGAGEVLMPADPTVAETLETPIMASVEAPHDANRSFVFVCLSGTHSWEQIPSTAPYRFTGSYRVYVTSAALPAACTTPHQIQFGVGFDGEIASSPSAEQVVRSGDPTPCFLLEERVLGPLVEFHCGLTPEDAAAAAHQLIHAASTWEFSARIRIRSVGSFELGNASLSLFSD